MERVPYVGEGRKDHTHQNGKNVCASPMCCVPRDRGSSIVDSRVVVLGYFSCSEEEFFNTSSQMWCNWYFPMFALRDGSLAHMYMASFTVMITPYPSLPTLVNIPSPLVVLWCGCVDEWGMGLWNVF